MKKSRLPMRAVLSAAVAIALAGCAAQRMHNEGMTLIQEGKLEDGLGKLDQAQQADPGNGAFKKDLLIQRDQIIKGMLRDASQDRLAQRWEVALQRYARVLAIDRANITARQAINDINVERRQAARIDEAALLYGKGDFDQANTIITRVLLENPGHVRANALRSQILEMTQSQTLNGVSLNMKGKKPVTLQFRDANLRMVMEALSKTTGLNVMFDKDVKNDLRVTIFVRDTPVDEAIDLILMQTQTAKRVLNENSILIYADNEAKSREYAELKIRRFAMTNADPKNVMSMVKTMTKTKDMFVDEKTNSLVVRDTPQVIRMIEKLIVAMDQPEPEVMLEVDVVEVSRDRSLALGINLPTSFGVSIPAMSLEDFKNLTDSRATVGGLAVGVTAQKTDGDANTLATPRIRVRNKEKAKFLVGDRLPVISSAATPSVTGGASVYNTSVQYVEVGIKIEAEPTVYADGEVAIRLTLEVSSASAPNADAAKSGTIAYSIGTRSVTTVLRLKDGQTEIIGGLIQDVDTSDATRIPGLGDIPILGRLFGVQTDVKKKKEVIMSITPRIIRNNRQVDSDLLEIWSGTENSMRFGTGQLGSTKLQAPATPLVAVATGTAGTTTPTAPARTAAAATVRPLTLTAVQSARVGELISVTLSAPPLVSAAALEANLSYDTAHLKLVQINEADVERNRLNGIRFAGNSAAPGAVKVELTAGRGETLPPVGANLAILQFEVLAPAGLTQIKMGKSVTTNLENTSVALPPAAPVEIEVNAALAQ